MIEEEIDILWKYQTWKPILAQKNVALANQYNGYDCNSCDGGCGGCGGCGSGGD